MNDLAARQRDELLTAGADLVAALTLLQHDIENGRDLDKLRRSVVMRSASRAIYRWGNCIARLEAIDDEQ